MPTLLSLEFDFPYSHSIFAPSPSREAPKLSSSFPNLTCLSITSRTFNYLPSEWTQSLPQSLLSLSLDCCPTAGGITASAFNALPRGLTELQFGRYCSIRDGEIDFRRFSGLRVLRLYAGTHWTVLDSLPDSLEELLVHMDSLAGQAVTFPFSKLPPTLRVWDLSGPGIDFDFDCKAPSTLEELRIETDVRLKPERLEQFFHTKNLRRLSTWGIGPYTPALMATLPNVEEFFKSKLFFLNLPTVDFLPKKLKTISIVQNDPNTKPLAVKDLPPHLESLKMRLWCSEDLAALPRTLKHLRIYPPPAALTLRHSPSALRTLPPHLKSLHLKMNSFESPKCMHALPAGLEKLTLDIYSFLEMIEDLTFPPTMQKNLRKLSIHYYGDNSAGDLRLDTLVPKMNDSFSRLESLNISAKILIYCNTLSNLPKSLTELNLSNAELDEYGLPEPQDPKNSDWTEGAFSRLPEGLVSLQLRFNRAVPYSIDFKVFSRLPKRLASLFLHTSESRCDSPRQFVANLPRRLGYIKYVYTPTKNIDGMVSPREKKENEKLDKEFEEALREYYADPFWDENDDVRGLNDLSKLLERMER